MKTVSRFRFRSLMYMYRNKKAVQGQPKCLARSFYIHIFIENPCPCGYTDNPDLIASSIPSLWVMLSSYLFAVPGFIYFFSVSGTGNTRRALEIDMASIFVYVLYILYVAVWLRADVAVCWTTEYVYNIMILSSFFYLWKGNWRNKKI